MRKAHRLSHSTQSSKPLYTNNEDICHSKRTLESIKKSKRPSFVDEKEHPSVNQRPNFANGFSLISLSDLVAFMPNAAMFANTLDIHSLYKLRLSRSSQKLENFFGESAPIDLCTHEIRKEGLKAILQSKVPLCYFLYFLLDEYNSENLVNYKKPDPQHS